MSTKALFRAIGVEELAVLPQNHSFVDALEALLQSAATGSLRAWLTQQAKNARGRKLDVAPLIEVTLHTPGTVGDIRIAGLNSGSTAAVRYTLPDPWDRTDGKKPSDKEMDAWAAKVRRNRAHTDFEQSGRVSARTILYLAEALAAA
jgi:hypothetical protein